MSVLCDRLRLSSRLRSSACVGQQAATSTRCQCQTTRLIRRSFNKNSRTRHSCVTRCKSGSSPDDDDDGPPKTARNQLEATIRRKSTQVQAMLQELGMEGLEERLQSGVRVPAQPAYRLASMIAQNAQQQGRGSLLLEIARPSPSSTSTDLAALARQCVAAGADGLVVRTDTEDTPEGLKDLFTVCQAVKVPVLRKDWMIHPLQVVEAKEAGAAGVLGVVAQVNGRGTAVLSSFAAAIGLDAPVEIVNKMEADGLGKAGVPFYGINIAVGLSVAIPGFSSKIAHGLLGELPFGALSLVGVRSVEEARRARLSGADALLIKKELLDEHKGPEALQQLVQQLKYVTDGDD